MKKITICLAAIIFVGCADIAPNYSSLPANATSDQKTQAIIADAKLKLEDTAFQEAVYNTLVMAGKLALNHAVNDEEREEIKLQLYSWGKMFDDLSTGDAISALDVQNAVAGFNLKFDADKNSDFIIAANGLFNMTFPLLKTVGDAKLAIKYAQIAARASKAIGGSE